MQEVENIVKFEYDNNEMKEEVLEEIVTHENKDEAICENIQIETLEDSEDNLESLPETEPNKIEWSDRKVDLLLTLYLEHLKEFRDSKYKKKDIWKKLAPQLGYSPEACDRKFRNAKQRYQRLIRHGKKAVTRWPHLQKMSEILKGDPSSAPILIKKEHLSDNQPSVLRKRYLGQGEVKARKIDHANEVKVTTRFQDLAENLSNKQEEICNKIDELVSKIQESNVIQIRRNELFEKYIEALAKKM
ncbi:uncharacterized protein [Euwallacea fornicatus]|uniref:uncharacterized protein n=1 Tax=Euwallacea fornicatus TaxID=995702 RepID=UPI00338EEB57